MAIIFERSSRWRHYQYSTVNTHPPMSEFGDPEYFRQPAPLDSHLVDLDYPVRQKESLPSSMLSLNIEKPVLPTLKSTREPVEIDSKGEIVRLPRRPPLDRILIDPVHESRCSIDFDEESTCTGNLACFPTVPLKFPSPPLAPCPASWSSNAGATTHVPCGERRRTGISGLPGVSRTALKAVFQAARLAARCSWSTSPCVLYPRAEWSRF